MIKKKKSVHIIKNEQKEIGGLASLDSELQVRIRRYLALGDFRSAKALYDDGLESKRSGAY